MFQFTVPLTVFFTLITHPNNSSPDNPPLTHLPVPVGGGVAHAYQLLPLFSATLYDAP